MLKKILFFVDNFNLSSISIYNYALYNEAILNNYSYILYYNKTNNDIFKMFEERFKLFSINDINDMTNINEYKVNYFYIQYNNVNNDEIIKQMTNIKIIKHYNKLYCNFDNDNDTNIINLGLSNYLNIVNKKELIILPYIIRLSNTNKNLLTELNIPEESIVFGRYGEINEFNIQFVKDAIINILKSNKNIYFIFMNTEEFYKHDNIKYLPMSIDFHYKRLFINSCDAMIHANINGEYFGLSVAEFSYCNKPIITSKTGCLEHILTLQNTAILYESETDLINIFNNMCKNNVNTNYNKYEKYSPDVIINYFNSLIN